MPRFARSNLPALLGIRMPEKRGSESEIPGTSADAPGGSVPPPEGGEFGLEKKKGRLDKATILILIIAALGTLAEIVTATIEVLRHFG